MLDYLNEIEIALLRTQELSLTELEKHEAFLLAKDLVSELWDKVRDSQERKKAIAAQLRLALSKWSIVPSKRLRLQPPCSEHIEALVRILGILKLPTISFADEIEVEKSLRKVGIETRLEIRNLSNLIENH